MDNNIGKIGSGSYNWTVGSDLHKKAVPTPSPQNESLNIFRTSDAVSLSGAPGPAPEVVTHEATHGLGDAPPAATAPKQRESVPVSLLAEDFSPTSLGSSGASYHNPVAHLGVMAQLDEAGPVHSVTRIDGPSQPNAFGDLHLVGPSNAARYLANPNELYLGM